MATWKKVVVSGSSAELAGLTVDAQISGDISGNAGGNAATATKISSITNSNIVQLASAQSLTNKDLTGAGNTFPTFNQSTSGNAATATALAASVNIGGVAFDGQSSIILPGVDSAGSQDTSGNAGTATALAASRDLQVSLGTTSAQSFDGSGNATSIGVSGTLGTAQGGLGFVPNLVAGKIIKVNALGTAFELADDDAGSVTASSTTTFSNKTINSSNNSLTIAQADVTGLSTALSGKQDTITSGDLAISDTSGLQTALDAKATSAALTSGLAGKQDTITSGDLAISDTSGLQTALDAKATSAALTSGLAGKEDTITGAATTITGADLAVSRALVSNGSGKVAVSDVTSTEIGYLDGVTSAIQTQLNSKVGSSDNTFTGTTTIDALSVTGNATLGNALTDTVTVEGDLRVKGTASFESSENLLVKDQFIGLGSGSNAGQDGGIVIEDSTSNGGQGHAFAYKDDGGAETNANNRWVVAKDVPFNSTTISPDAFMAAVIAPAAANTPAAIDTLAGTDYSKTGNIYTSNANDIWIYA